MRRSRFPALLALVALAHAMLPPILAAQDRSEGSRTDQSVDVTRGARFRLESLAGAVIIRAWDKDVVRVQARHPAATRVRVRSGRSAVTVTSDATDGEPGAVQYDVNVPRWMAVSIEVTFDSITVEGTESDVAAETVRGHVTIKGGAGSVRAESVEGRVVIEGARARVEATSVNDLIRVDGVVGDISAETTNGTITLTRIQASSVEASTVNGTISYEGAVADDGHYNLTTHNGDIVVAMPARSNVTFEVTTYHGSFNSDLPVKGTPASRRGGHGLYTLGSGNAQMGLESFGGSIRLRDSATARPAKP